MTLIKKSALERLVKILTQYKVFFHSWEHEALSLLRYAQHHASFSFHAITPLIYCQNNREFYLFVHKNKLIYITIMNCPSSEGAYNIQEKINIIQQNYFKDHPVAAPFFIQADPFAVAIGAALKMKWVFPW